MWLVQLKLQVVRLWKKIQGGREDFMTKDMSIPVGAFVGRIKPPTRGTV